MRLPLLLLSAVLVGWPSVAAADDAAPLPTVPPVVDGVKVSESYGAVTVAQAELEAARNFLRATSAALGDAEVVLADALAEATRRQLGVDAAQRALDEAQGDSGEVGVELLHLREGVDAMASAAYINGGLEPGTLDDVFNYDPSFGLRFAFLQAASVDQAALVERQLLVRTRSDAVVVEAVDQLLTAQGQKQQADSNVLIATENRDAALSAVGLAEERLKDASEGIGEARTTLLALAPSVTLDTVDIPVLAVDAYLRAADWASLTFSDCSIEWYVIAGIARQESNHGRFGGSAIQADGQVFPKIIGIALDGTRSLAIPDTDAGVLDGDSVWDRAIGPTQFIPETWRSYAARFDLDGNRDGREDPHNIYDQSRATATLLCRNGWVEGSADREWAAVYSYNPSRDYVTKVLNWISGYRTVSLPDISLVSPVSAPLPTPPPVAVDVPTYSAPTSSVPAPATTIDPPARPGPTTTLPATTLPGDSTSTTTVPETPPTTAPETPTTTVPATPTTTVPATPPTTTVPETPPTTTTAPETPTTTVPETPTTTVPATSTTTVPETVAPPEPASSD